MVFSSKERGPGISWLRRPSWNEPRGSREEIGLICQQKLKRGVEIEIEKQLYCRGKVESCNSPVTLTLKH